MAGARKLRVENGKLKVKARRTLLLNVGATTMFSKKTCRLAIWSSEVISVIAAHPSVTDTRKSYQTRRGELCSPAISVTDFLLKAVILSGARRYCKKKRHSSTNPCAVEPFFDRVRRKKANKQLACAVRDLQKDYI